MPLTLKFGLYAKDLVSIERYVFSSISAPLSTIISENDAEKLKIDYTSLQKLPKGMTGIGGSAKTYLMEGIELYFESERGLYRPNMNHIFVIKNAAKGNSKVKQLIPSLLGRDFLNQMALLVDKRQNLVLITDEILTA